MKNLLYVILVLIIGYNLGAQDNTNAITSSSNSIEISVDKTVGKNNLTVYADHGILAVANLSSLNVEARLFSTKSNVFHIYGRAGFGKMRTRKHTKNEVLTGSNSNNGTSSGFGPGIVIPFPSSSNSILGYTTVTQIERTKALGGIAALTMLAGRDKHNFEISLGAFLGKKLETENDEFFPYPIIGVGYRYQPTNRILFHTKIGSQGIGLGLGIAFL